MEVGFDLGGLDAEDEAEFAEKQLLCHFPVAKLRRDDAAAQRREALLLLIEGFSEAEQTLAIMLGEDAAVIFVCRSAVSGHVAQRLQLRQAG